MQKKCGYILNLFLFIIFFTICLPASAQDLKCGGIFPEVPDDSPCVEVKEFGLPAVIGGAEIKLYRFTRNWQGASNDVETLKQIASASLASLNYFSKFMTLKPISFFFVNEYPPGNWAAMAGWEGTPCHITVFYGFDTASEGAKQAVAHEIFHCLQAINIYLPPDYNHAHSANWWVEGSADYFSDLVYPKANREHYNQRQYNLDVPITEQKNPYSTSLFFQFLKQEGVGEINTIIQELKKQPRNNNKKGALTALATWPLMDYYFHEFAKAILNKTISDSGGGLSGMPSTGPSFQFELDPYTPAVTIGLRPFAATTLELKMPRGAKVELRIDEVRAINGLKISYRKLGDTGFISLKKEAPFKYESQCDTEDLPTYEFVFTSIEADEDQLTMIKLNQMTKAQDCACLAPKAIIDPCLKGNWKVDNIMTGVRLRDYFKGTKFEQDDYAIEDVNYTGDVFLQIGEGISKSGQIFNKNMSMQIWKKKTGEGKRIVGFGIDANFTLTFMQDDSKNICMKNELVDGTYTVVNNGESNTRDASEFLSDKFVSVQYTCGPTQLVFWVNYPGGQIPSTTLLRQ